MAEKETKKDKEKKKSKPDNDWGGFFKYLLHVAILGTIYIIIGSNFVYTIEHMIPMIQTDITQPPYSRNKNYMEDFPYYTYSNPTTYFEHIQNWLARTTTDSWISSRNTKKIILTFLNQFKNNPIQSMGVHLGNDNGTSQRIREGTQHIMTLLYAFIAPFMVWFIITLSSTIGFFNVFISSFSHSSGLYKFISLVPAFYISFIISSLQGFFMNLFFFVQPLMFDSSHVLRFLQKHNWFFTFFILLLFIAGIASYLSIPYFIGSLLGLGLVLTLMYFQ